jgi:glyoxylase-like metal-dependent hydrolase (beta-lactamase superfamily II)
MNTKKGLIFLQIIGLAGLIMLLNADEINDAVRAGDLAKVQLLIEKNPGLVNAKNPAGQTPLFDAVMSRRLEIAEYLISKGADVNARNNFHMSPLHIACNGNTSLEIVRLLVEKGADLNAEAKYLGKPLDLAYENAEPPLVQYLSSKGAQCTPLDFQVVPLSEKLRRIAFPWGMRNNLVVSSGPDGILIVDTGFSKRAIETIKKTIGRFANGDIKYIINTHADWDHVAGNGLASSIENVIGFQKLNGGEFPKIISKTDKPLQGRQGQTLPAPYSLPFNGEEIKIIPYPGLHSEADVLVYFTISGVVCMGDLLLSQNFPAVRDAKGYRDFLNDVIGVFPDGTRFVSGHGRELTLEELKKYRNMLNTTFGIMKMNVEAGKSAEEIIRADVLSAYRTDYSFLDWLGPDMWILQITKNLKLGI